LETIVFNNEHLFIGNLGHFAVVLAFVSAIISAFAYAFSVNMEMPGLKKLGRIMFLTHAVAVALIFFTLFYIIHSHYFEYQYAYQHSSRELPVYYMISCFWEGQEGSFLLWMFWHAVLGVVLMFKARSWEAPVLTVVALAQVILGSMLLGFQLGDFKIGSSPFILMREYNPEALLIPVLEKMGKANYLQVYKDGNGLNPLLQNYWMVIHPPTLFFGFAATIVPFAFAFAGLWTRRMKEWMIPALPWALVAVLVLGTGIIMGGYWAYESLSFGGYWAWDPVENASLMPWLLLITATHMLLINKSTGKYPVLTFVLTIFSFFMVLYATFLTRSGILGNASVHSFTDLGLSGQLILLLFSFIFLTYAISFKKNLHAWIFFLVSFMLIMFITVVPLKMDVKILSSIGAAVLLLSTVLFVRNLFRLHASNIETDKLYSREFWMFVGSMVLLLSGFQIITMTSIPVFNKLFETSKASAGEDYYNSVQIWFAIPIVILTAFGQFFRYKQSDTKKVVESIANTLLIALVLSVGALFLFDIWEFKFMLLVICSIYAIVGNAYYMVKTLKGNVKVSGASMAHVGFGLMMLGVLVSSVNKKILSVNTSGTGYFSETNAEGKPDDNAKLNNKENILLAKDKSLMFANNQLKATYKSSDFESPNTYFNIKYEVLDKDGKVKDEFTLRPNKQDNPKMGLVSNPDTRHYLTRDIFTYVTYESGMEKQEEKEFDNFKTDTVAIGQSFVTMDGTRQLTLNKINVMEASADSRKLHLQAEIIVNSIGDTFIARPEFISDEQIRIKESIIDKAGVMLIFDRVMPDPKNPQNMMFIISSGIRKPKIEYVILKAIEFPYINLLWAGTFVMIFGFILSIIQRFKESKRRMENQLKS
jgi:cytochrome c-type biogenesis protein CcmF